MSQFLIIVAGILVPFFVAIVLIRFWLNKVMPPDQGPQGKRGNK